MKEIAKMLMLGGGIILVVGFIVYFSGDSLKWFGNLPADIRVERSSVSF